MNARRKHDPPVEHVQHPGIKVYHVLDLELDTLIREGEQVPAALILSFATLSLGAFISFLVALTTADIQNNTTIAVYVAIMITTGITSLVLFPLFFVQYSRHRRNYRNYAKGIRDRGVPDYAEHRSLTDEEVRERYGRQD